MAGRHRAPTPSWRLPAATGASAAILLGVATWMTSQAWETPESRALTSAAGGQSASATVPTTTVTTPPPTTTTTTKARATTSKKPPAPKVTPKPKPATTKAPAPVVTSCSSTLAGTQPHVAQVGNHILTKFAVSSVIGMASRSGASEHPSGLALDFMVGTATGDALAQYVLANRSAFGVKYVIWRQRYNDGGGWSMMADRGSATANHYDHVHVSFLSKSAISHPMRDLHC